MKEPSFCGVICAVMLAVGACAEPPAAPPVTLGQLTLTRSQLVQERYTLEIPLFNTGTSQLERYLVSAHAVAETAAEEPALPHAVELEIVEPLAGRARAVQTVTFDCPLAVIPPLGLTLEQVTFSGFHFSNGFRGGVIEYGYPVEETQ